MKNNKNEIIRLQSIIENDRISTSDNFNKLLMSDLTDLLKDYFDFKDNLTLNIERNGSCFQIGINLLVTRIKNFINIEQ